MRKIIYLFITFLFFACNSKGKDSLEKTKPKLIEDSILEFCKSDNYRTSDSTSTIKYDSTSTGVARVPRNYKYYNKMLNDVYESYGSKQIEDTISKKWFVTLHFDSENTQGAMIRNNVKYIIKENTQYHHDTILNEPFIVLMKRDQNKIREYLDRE